MLGRNQRYHFVSDIIDALSEGSLNLPAGHGREYWSGEKGKLHTKKEIFANIFSVEAFAIEENLDFVHKNFPDLYSAYLKLL